MLQSALFNGSITLAAVGRVVASGVSRPVARVVDDVVVPHQVEDLHVAIQYRLPLVRLVDGHGLDPAGLAAVRVGDGVEQGGKAGGIHWCALYGLQTIGTAFPHAPLVQSSCQPGNMCPGTHVTHGPVMFAQACPWTAPAGHWMNDDFPHAHVPSLHDAQSALASDTSQVREVLPAAEPSASPPEAPISFPPQDATASSSNPTTVLMRRRAYTRRVPSVTGVADSN